MYMNLFNQFNARKVSDEEMNFLANIQNNLLYILIVASEFLVVFVMTHYNPDMFSIKQIPGWQHWIAFTFGVISLGVGAGLRKAVIPKKFS